MCGGGGGSSQPTRTETITKTEPFAEQKPYLTTGFERAKTGVLDNPLEYYPESTVVEYSPETEAGLNLATQRAAYGSPEVGAASGELQRTLGGDYLAAGNPYREALTNRIAGDVGSAVDTRFAQGDRYGSPLHQEAVARGIGDALAPYQFADYTAERDRMGQAVGQAPLIGKQAYVDAAQLRDVGADREALDRARLSEDISRHAYEQTEPLQRIENYMRLVQGQYGGQGTSVGEMSDFRGGGIGGRDLLGVGSMLGSAYLLGGKVICTAAYFQGLIDEETWRADGRYGQTLDMATRIGYWAWAIPIADAMHDHRWFARFVTFLAKPVIVEMAARGGKGKGSRIGTAMLAIGLPMCRKIGGKLSHAPA